jgi:hypothetical protein
VVRPRLQSIRIDNNRNLGLCNPIGKNIHNRRNGWLPNNKPLKIELPSP